MEHRLDHPTYNTAPDGKGFRVQCSCGWRSPWCANSTHARAVGEQHLQLQPGEDDTDTGEARALA